MKKLYSRGILVGLLALIAVGTSFGIYKKQILNKIENNNQDENDNDFIKGESFLNYETIRCLKNTGYTLKANVSPLNHTSPITWTTDFPSYIKITDNHDDSVTIERIEDYRGYVNVTASVDGLKASCKIYSKAEIHFNDIHLDNSTKCPHTAKNQFYDANNSDGTPAKLVVYVDVTHDLVNYTKEANDAKITAPLINQRIGNPSSLYLGEPQFLSMENTKTISLYDGVNNKSSKFLLTYIINNMVTNCTWEKVTPYKTFKVCDFVKYTAANSLNLTSPSLTL